jgi:selenocysteine lyase/cysteine desulfurase
VVFTSNATDALNGAIAGVLAGAPGAVVTTPLEHNSVMRPLRRHAGEVRMVRPDESFRIRPAALEAVLDDDVRLVVVGHASNVVGVAQDLGALAAVCRARGVPFLVDASQSVGVLDLDVSGIDLAAFSGHKNLYGPGGVGVLYVDPAVDLPPWRVGGTGGYASDLETQPDALPWRLEAGTPNGAGIVGLLAGLRFVRERGLARIRQHHFNLARRLLAQLVILDNVEVHNPDPDLALVSFSLRGWDPLEVARVLDESFDIAVGAGLSCAPDAHRWLGTSGGALRVSGGLFNTEADIDALGAAIAQMAEMDVYSC